MKVGPLKPTHQSLASVAAAANQPAITGVSAGPGPGPGPGAGH